MSNLTSYLLFIYSYHFFFIYVNGTISFFLKKNSVLVDSCQICQLRPKKTHKTFQNVSPNFRPTGQRRHCSLNVLLAETHAARELWASPLPKIQVTFGISVVLSSAWHLLHRINWLTCKACNSVWPGFDERRSKPIRRMTYIHAQICRTCETLLPWQKETLNVVLLIMIVKSTYSD